MGYNYRLTDIQAAVGREQLKRLPQIVQTRRQLARTYRTALASEAPSVGLPEEPDGARSNWQSFCVRLPDGRDQRTVMQAMLDAEVATRRGVMCAHREAAYAGAELRFPLPASEAAQDRCIILPFYPQMGDAEVERVASALAAAVRS
jgi:dTDP-4-amino-4,6-dideoxygalactose transaminase